MSARFADTMYFDAAPTIVAASTSKHGAFRRAIQWVLEMPRRRAVINELDALSDHELADIGLSRVDVTRVFDRSFGEQRVAG